jgi:hypothetical protein
MAMPGRAIRHPSDKADKRNPTYFFMIMVALLPIGGDGRMLRISFSGH